MNTNKEIAWWKEEGYDSREDCEKQRAYGHIVGTLVAALKEDGGFAFDERLRVFIETEIIPEAPNPEKLRESAKECFRLLEIGREASKAGKIKEKIRQAAIDKAIKENSLSDYFAALPTRN
jgi:hypothetical protein